MEKRILIGIPTYNGTQRVKLLLSSILNYTRDLSNVDIVVVDDGTPDQNEKAKLGSICRDLRVTYFEHVINRGIPASWNTLVKSKESDLYVLLNDDVQICNALWLEYMVYFFENNSNVGTVSYLPFYLDPRTSLPQEGYPLPVINTIPEKMFSPNGQGFAFTKEAFDLVQFNEDFCSFYEEADFGYELYEKGYASYMLPFPIIQHWGSQTFGSNPELALTVPHKKLPMDEYKKLLTPYFSDEKIEPRPGNVYRMEYSRVLFALKWGCKDYWARPQDEVNKRLQIKPQLIKWLDKDRNRMEMVI